MNNFSLYNNRFPLLKLKNGKFILFNPWTSELFAAKRKTAFSKLKLARKKFVPHRRRYAPFFPKIAICLGYKCNLRCKYCYVYGGENKEETITRDILYGIWKFIAKTNPKQVKITFTGGEPTLYPDLIKYVVNKLKKLKIKKYFVINTNGVINLNFLKFLVKNNFIFQLSIDGLPQIHDRCRILPNGMDSAKYVFKTLDYLLKHKAKIVVRSVVTDYSVKFMPQAVNFFADRGVKYLRFETVNPWGRAEKLDIKPPSNRDYLRYFKKAFRISLKRKVSLISGSLLNFFTPSIHSCLTMSGEEMIVLPSGKVTGCYAVFNNDHPLSNPFIYGHYNNRKKEFVLDKCKKNILRNFNVENIKKCSACPLKYLCSGGCPLVHYTHTRLRNLYNVSKKWCELTKGIGSSIIEELFRYYYIKKNKKVAKDKNE